jgi:c-di-GMP-binding flagellar brake protein YcgR
MSGHFEDYSDRRRDERRIFRGGALWMPVGKAATQVRTLDVSAGGIAIVATFNPPAGCLCLVRFVLPTRDGPFTVETSGRVARSVFSSTDDGFRVGLHFDPLSDEAARALQRYVRG